MMTLPRIAGVLTLILVVRVVTAAHNGNPGSPTAPVAKLFESGARPTLIVLTGTDLPGRLNAANPRQVLWHVAPGDPHPFGFIPTRWTTQPELLPLNWDVQTVFARSPVGTRKN